jgi:hypothetical protein
MSQRLQKSSYIAGSAGLNDPPQGTTDNRKKQTGGQAASSATGEGEAYVADEAAREPRPDPHSAEYILAMVHDLKKLAAKSGLQRVALILEMAELEARDQLGKPTQ